MNDYHMEIAIEGDVSKVLLNNAKLKCTNCKKWKGAEKFGFRKMRTRMLSTTVAVMSQSQCNDCRKGSK